MQRSAGNFLALCAFLNCNPAGAEEAADTVLVTASRLPAPRAAIGSSVTVIDRATIERRQSTQVTDLLRDVPGFSVSSSGSIGAQTQVRVRGAEANQILVLIDGVEANDPAGNGEFGFQDLSTWNVERIEIVRGPQSALWGSDALAGAVNVITRAPEESLSLEGYAETGRFDTLNTGARLGGEVLGMRSSLAVSRLDSDGSNTSRTGTEEDGYDNTTVNLALAGKPSEALDLAVTARYTSTDKAFDGDGDFDGLPEDRADTLDSDFAYLGARAGLALAGEKWLQSVRLNWTGTDSETRNASTFTGSTAADKYGLYYQTSWQFTPATADAVGNALTLALEHEREKFRQRGPVIFGDPNQNQELQNSAAVLELQLAPAARTSLTFSTRQDENSDFDDVATFRATAAHVVAGTRTRLHASAGSGQKSPTFIERYGFFPDGFIGNPELEPEKSRGWELGFEQPIADSGATLGVTYFREKLKDEINGFVQVDDPDPDVFVFTAENVDGTSHRQGVEVSASAQLGEPLRLNATYTYLDASEPDGNGDEVAEIRRPRHTGSLNADWSFPNGRTSLNVDFSYTGERTDQFFSFPITVETLGAYGLVSISATHRLTEQLQIYGRLENALDQDYEDVVGFNTPGAAAYVGLRARL
jgi:vitamin B12 transporter